MCLSILLCSVGLILIDHLAVYLVTSDLLPFSACSEGSVEQITRMGSWLKVTMKIIMEGFLFKKEKWVPEKLKLHFSFLIWVFLTSRLLARGYKRGALNYALIKADIRIKCWPNKSNIVLGRVWNPGWNCSWCAHLHISFYADSLGIYIKLR